MTARDATPMPASPRVLALLLIIVGASCSRPTGSVASNLAHGDRLVGQRDYDEAVRAYSTAIRLDPGCAAAYRGSIWMARSI